MSQDGAGRKQQKEGNNSTGYESPKPTPRHGQKKHCIDINIVVGGSFVRDNFK
jgi:hypothetical protein